MCPSDKPNENARPQDGRILSRERSTLDCEWHYSCDALSPGGCGVSCCGCVGTPSTLAPHATTVQIRAVVLFASRVRARRRRRHALGFADTRPPSGLVEWMGKPNELFQEGLGICCAAGRWNRTAIPSVRRYPRTR